MEYGNTCAHDPLSTLNRIPGLLMRPLMYRLIQSLIVCTMLTLKGCFLNICGGLKFFWFHIIQEVKKAVSWKNGDKNCRIGDSRSNLLFVIQHALKYAMNIKQS